MLVDSISRSLFDEPFWKWSDRMPRPRIGRLPRRRAQVADAVYFPSCISRIMGALPGEDDGTSVMQAHLNLADRAGITLRVPDDITGKCCGVPFSSKGFEEAHRIAVNRIIESMFRWSSEGTLPVMTETSPCSYAIKTARRFLTSENQLRFDKLVIFDSIEYVAAKILPALRIYRRAKSVAVHPVCSAQKAGIIPKLMQICNACSEEAFVPENVACCAFAGDRGLLFPELTVSATNEEAAQITEKEFDGYYSSSRTCELGMTNATGKVFRSYLHLVEFASRPPSEFTSSEF
jgi:D-lactate dehydrogenase